MLTDLVLPVSVTVAVMAAIVLALASIYSIGPTQVGLVRKRFGRKLPGDASVAFHGGPGIRQRC